MSSFNYRIDFALFSTWTFSDQPNSQSGFSLIPELQYTYSSSEKVWDSVFAFKLFSSANTSQVKPILGEPYRFWTRFLIGQMEWRIGLQKIDFGSASFLRPLQWFNNLSYEDPLQQTPGVWALLLRYYFTNNANLWLWGLWGNEDPRGLDPLKTAKEYPEAGGRIQFPLPRGETAFSFHYRMASAEGTFLEVLDRDPFSEIRGGWDGKWDLGIGLWMEMSLTHRFRSLGNNTDLLFINLGVDYTFPWGNGYHWVWENLVTSPDPSPFKFHDPAYDSIMVHTYPLTLFDTLSFTAQYRWGTQTYSLIFSWEHQFTSSVLNGAVYHRSLENGVGIKVFWNYVF